MVHFLLGQGNGSVVMWKVRWIGLYVIKKCDFWGSSACIALLSHHSDHNHLLLKLEKNDSSGPRPFRFLSMWTNHVEFLSIVTRTWSIDSWVNEVQIKLNFGKNWLEIFFKGYF